jgi:hypothetical protein
MRPDAVHFCGVDLSARIAVDDDGQQYPIVDLWDAWGQDIDDDDEVAFVVVKMSDDWLVGIDLSEFEDAPLH